jgi:hypothetical protein
VRQFLILAEWLKGEKSAAETVFNRHDHHGIKPVAKASA